MTRVLRFPREQALRSKDEPNGFSMKDVHEGLDRLAHGEKIGPKRMVLLCRWFDLDVVTPEIAKQIKLQLSDGRTKIKVRFPREE